MRTFEFHRSALRIAAPAALVVCVALGATGCKQDPLATDFDSIRSNLSPELQTLSERPEDVQRNIAVTFDQNGRSFWNDLGRAFYVDRPSIMTPYPIVPTGGQPR
jgi:hypothetical protein